VAISTYSRCSGLSTSRPKPPRSHFIPKSTEENMINCAEMTRGIVVSARIPPALLASVEEAAARLGLNRGQFVREAIQMAVRAENAARRLLEAS
jgi:hypothetical protein